MTLFLLSTWYIFWALLVKRIILRLSYLLCWSTHSFLKLWVGWWGWWLMQLLCQPQSKEGPGFEPVRRGDWVLGLTINWGECWWTTNLLTSALPAHWQTTPVLLLLFSNNSIQTIPKFSHSEITPKQLYPSPNANLLSNAPHPFLHPLANYSNSPTPVLK